MARIRILPATALLLFTGSRMMALQFQPTPVGPTSGTVPGSAPFGGASGGTGFRSAEAARRALVTDLAGRIAHYPQLAGYTPREQRMLGRIWAVCPQTFDLLRDLPASLRQRVTKDVLARAKTKWLLTGGFEPGEPVPLVVHQLNSSLRMAESLAGKAVDFERGDLWDTYAIGPHSETDATLARFTKKQTLERASIPATLREDFARLDDWHFMSGVRFLAGSPPLVAAIAALPKTLRPPAIERVADELADHDPADPGGSPTVTPAELARGFAALPRETEWPGVVAQIAKDLNAPVIDLRRTSEPRRIRCLVAHRGGVTTAALAVPRWEYLHVGKRIVANDLGRLLGPPGQADPVLFLGGDEDYSTHDLLPGRLTARTFDDSARFAPLHIANFRQLTGRVLEPSRTVLFNLIPDSAATLRQLGLTGGERRWQRARRSYDALIKRLGLLPGDGGSREALLAALKSGDLDTLIIVAHGEPDGIYLADGSRISVQDILDLEPLAADRRPLVLLVACETGRFNSALRSMAQALLLRGAASAVVAPKEKIPALGPTSRLLERLLNPGAPASEAFRHLAGPWQLYVENLGEEFLLRLARHQDCTFRS